MKLHGHGFLDRKLVAIRDAVSPRIIRDTLLDAGEIVAEEARRLVPTLTGNLRDSIGVQIGSAGMNFSSVTERRWLTVVYIGPRQGRNEPHDGFYGHMVEFGTSHSAPHPFMRPAVDNTRDEVRRVIAGRLWVSIKKAA